MTLTSADAKVEARPTGHELEVGETAGNCAAPAHTQVISGTTGAKSQVETKKNLARVAQNHRGDVAEDDANKSARVVTAMEDMRRRAERYREKPKDLDDLAAQIAGLEVDDKMAIYDEAFELHPVAVGKAISKRERDETKQTGNATLVYGEITFKTLALALHKVKTKYGLPGVGHSGKDGVLQKPGGAFYDIGSGTGKPVIAAAIVHPFDKSVGIEILEGLHATSLEVLKKWKGGLDSRVGHDIQTDVKFIRGDALDRTTCDWSDADVVFANSTCFDDALMRSLAAAATSLRKGSIFITLTKRLPAPYFKVLEHELCAMSWGSATVYISQKTTESFGDPNGPSRGEDDGGTE